MKDNFSSHASKYAQFRPEYPDSLYEFLMPLVKTSGVAWDCGTGNGQVAAKLAEFFQIVYATDVSERQLENAVKKENIFYHTSAAEQTFFSDNQFDLITVAQAIHWFDFDKFYEEVRRTIKPGGLFAVIGYGLLSVDLKTDPVIWKLYKEILGPYWDKERRYIDEGYKTIPFPFEEFKVPILANQYSWNLEQLIGYLNTWSSVQHYIKQHNRNPVDLVLKELEQAWGTSTQKSISFPIFLRLAWVNK